MDERIVVGDYTVDLRIGEIRADHRPPIRLAPKPLLALRVLVAHAGDVVGGETLRAEVWPETNSSDQALSRCVSELRRSFDDDSRAQRYIATEPKRGYRLVAPVHASADDLAQDPGVRMTSATSGPRRRRRRGAASVAAAAVATVAALALGTVSLAPSETAGPHAGTAASNDVRFAAFEVARRYHEQFDGNSSAARAVELFRRAVELNPYLADAHAGLAVVLCEQGSDSELQECRESARQALALDPRGPGGHHALGVFHASAGDPAAAKSSYERALALRPDHQASLTQLAALRARSGDFGGAFELLGTLDFASPTASTSLVRLGQTLLTVGDLGGARVAADLALRVRPLFDGAVELQARRELYADQIPGARTVVRRALMASPDNWVLLRSAALVEHHAGNVGSAASWARRSVDASGEGTNTPGWIRFGVVSRASGDPRASAAVLRPILAAIDGLRAGGDERVRLARYGALSSAGLGDAPGALEHLRRGADLGMIDVAWIRCEPAFAGVRGLASYGAFIEELTRRQAAVRVASRAHAAVALERARRTVEALSR